MRRSKSYIIIDQYINYNLNGNIIVDTKHYLIHHKDWDKIKQSIKKSKNVISYEETHFGEAIHYSTERAKYTLSKVINIAYKLYNNANAFTIPETGEPASQDYVSDLFW